jgi:hypothetical protein
MRIDKALYWDKLIDYYYDEIHWEKKSQGIYEWLEIEYNAISNTSSDTIVFFNEKKATWFLMKHGS